MAISLSAAGLVRIVSKKKLIGHNFVKTYAIFTRVNLFKGKPMSATIFVTIIFYESVIIIYYYLIFSSLSLSLPFILQKTVQTVRS